MSHKLLGLPYDQWIDAFLPIDDSEVDYTNYDRLFDGVVVHEKESEMYEPLVNALNGTDILGDFVLAETYARYDKSDKDKKKVDGGMYPKGSSAIEQKRTDWATVEVIIECKTNDSDPFDERASSGIPYSGTKRDTLGQIMTYASTVFEYQHLTHHFGVVILGSQARLARWDRSGIVFSSKFDYKKEPAKLARFFWRVAHATPEARGHDPTATRILPGSADYKTLEAWKAKELADDDYVARRFVKSLTDDRPWWRLQVTDNKHGTKEFLVGRPTFAAPGVVGRATRGYIALSVSDQHSDSPFVYLKDCWRVEHDRSELEGDILSYLNGKGVTNIPTALYHGDVEDHRTISQDFCRCAKSGCIAELVEEHEEQAVMEELIEEGAAEVHLHGPSHGNMEATSHAASDQRLDDDMASTQGDANFTSVADGEPGARKDPGTDGTRPRESSAPSRCHMKSHRHYRLVVKEVGLPLQEFPCGRILVWVIRDAIIAHEDAYKKAKIMHRDISVGNILIIPPNNKNKKSTYQGLLADWELSKRLDQYTSEARHPDRTGTWQFMSVHIQDHPYAQVEIADELESFLHVMIYCAIRYLPHTCDDVGDFMYEYFDDGVRRPRKPEAEYTCGILKGYVMDKGAIFTSDRVPITFLRSPRGPNSAPPTVADEHPINSIFDDLLKRFSARYSLADKGRGKQVSSFKAVLDKLRMEQELGAEAGEAQSQTSMAGLFTQLPKYIARGVIAARDALLSSSYVAAYLAEMGTKNKSQRPAESPERLYEGIQTHSLVIGLLNSASEELSSEWPGPEDRLPDQLNPDYKPNQPTKTREKRTATDSEMVGRVSSKRRRVDRSRA
ncbi:hypothetical protein PYCCODRAFT_1393895 [Trametes coccinea BRFM310]|uniref:Fungal-type protein kinase domain-containing protein n=1 Tax=Trametes coccinea (strain BRFM310) TaxID=1353009 RepID=A0A1Y2IJ19_TRAC3|nr:hypothetical protein PYCCODRAFT_1393895 [Trametes coccinea BRFM310]